MIESIAASSPTAKPQKKSWRVFWGIALLLMIMGAISGKQEKSIDNSQRERKGFHCLSSWNGTNSAFIDQFKKKLRDPSSFEHIETRIAPLNGNGEHTIVMEYRARNGFGGMNVGHALGTLGSDCAVKSVGAL